MSLIVAGLTWAAASCADFHRGPAPRDAGGSPDTEAAQVADLMFETQVYPILQVRCEDCHSATGVAVTSRLVLTGNARADRAMIVALVTPSSPADSLLLLRATGGDAHPGEVRLPIDSVEYQTVFNWISMLAP